MSAADNLAIAVEAFVNDAYSYSQTHGVCPCGSDEQYCHFDATTAEEHLPLLRAALAAYRAAKPDEWTREGEVMNKQFESKEPK